MSKCENCKYHAMRVKTEGRLIKKEVITYFCSSDTTKEEKKEMGCN